MGNAKKIFLCKLLQKRFDTKDDTKCHIYLQSKWLDDAVELLLQDSNFKCYKGRLAIKEMRDSSSELEIPYHELYKEIYGALTTNLSPEFISEIGPDELIFKLIKRKDFDVVYIEVKLHEVRGNHEMLETAIELIDATSQQKDNMKEAQQTIGQRQVELAGQDAAKFEEEKKKMLKKFVMLLNSKKAKVEELKEKLELLQSSDAPMRSDSGSNEDERVQQLNVKPSTSVGNQRTAIVRRKARGTVISDDDDDEFSAITQPMTQTITRSSIYADGVGDGKEVDYDDST